MINSRVGEPGAAFLLPVGQVTDLTTSGKGIVYRPNYLETSDFSDAGEDFASISDNTFEADGSNYFEGQIIRGGSDDGNNYVVTNVGGTTGTDTITTDRNIEESNGDDIFVSDYYSLVTILDNQSGQKDEDKRNFSDELYPKNLYIFLMASNDTSKDQIDLIFANGVEIIDFYPDSYSDLPYFPAKKVVMNDNNSATANLYYCKPF